MTPLISPCGGGSGLHLKPLNTIIGWVLTLYCPSRRQGRMQKKNTTKEHHTCWLFCRPWRSAGTIPSTLPNRGDQGYDRRHWSPPVGEYCVQYKRLVSVTPVFPRFSIVNLLFSRSRWHQGFLITIWYDISNWPGELSDLFEYLLRRYNLVQGDLTIKYWNGLHRLKIASQKWNRTQ